MLLSYEKKLEPPSEETDEAGKENAKPAAEPGFRFAANTRGQPDFRGEPTS